MEPVHIPHLDEWLDTFGPGIGLSITSNTKSLAACWAQHPVAVHEITGLYLAWTALVSLFEPPDELTEGQPFMVVNGRDWLDLSNSSDQAVERAKAAAVTCARVGEHIATATK